MKKVILYVACVLIVSSAMAAEAPGSTIIQKFNETFPNAKNVKWRDDKDGYFVSFYQNGNFNKVFYNTSGSFVYSLKYSNGDDLPTNVVMSLNKNFGEYKNLGVTEATSQNGTLYNIKVSKNDKLYNVNVTADGSITEQETYINGASNTVASAQ